MYTICRSGPGNFNVIKNDEDNSQKRRLLKVPKFHLPLHETVYMYVCSKIGEKSPDRGRTV